MRLAVVVATVTAALVAGCGGISDADREMADQKVTEAENALREIEGDLASTASDASRCQQMVAPLVGKLEGLESILNTVGLTYANYGEEVSGIAVAYGEINPGRLGLKCLGPGTKAERAVRAYIEAHDTWQVCIEDLYCDTDSIDEDLQSEWLTASLNIERSRRQLSRLQREAGTARESIERAEQTLIFAQSYPEEIEADEKTLVEADRAMVSVATEWADHFAAGDIEAMCAMTTEDGTETELEGCAVDYGESQYGDRFEEATVERSITDGEDGTVEFSNGEILTLKPVGETWAVNSFQNFLEFGLYE